MSYGKPDLQFPSGFEEVIDCPYDKAHQILRHRMQTHLVKCRKNFPNTNLVFCPFNATHHIPETEYKFHINICPDKASLDKYKYTLETGQEMFGASKDPAIYHESVDSEESWDDYNVDTYNPQKYAESANVIRTKALIGMPPSQRKKFRQEEVIRLNCIQD